MSSDSSDIELVEEAVPKKQRKQWLYNPNIAVNMQTEGKMRVIGS